MVLPPKVVHPAGEVEIPQKQALSTAIEVETYAGKVHVEWDPTAAVTPIGQLAFFIEFLKLGYRFEQWVDDCPLYYASNNAPKKIDVLGSLFLSILSGHNRYTHLTALRGDTVNTKLLGMNKVVSDDSAIRALKRMDEAAAIRWLQSHLQSCYEPLLSTPWILDVDVTVKPLYGHQEGAQLGYNPRGVTTRTSRGVLRILITATSWPIPDWCWKWMCNRETNPMPVIPCRACTNFWSVFLPTVSRRLSEGIVIGATIR